jgi:thiaminase
MELNEQIKSLVIENKELLGNFIKEIQSQTLSMETLEQEINFLKELHRQLSLLVRDDADNSIIIRLSRLEGMVAEFHKHIEKETDPEKKAGNTRLGMIIAIITGVTSLLSQIVEAIFGKH